MIPGGVAIFWNKKYDKLVQVVRLDVDWATGIEFNCNYKKIIIWNIFTPYEYYHNEGEYFSRLAYVMAFISASVSTWIYVIGDMNAEVSDVNALLANHLQ